MSLALALRGSDGLVLASDSRVSSAEGREDTSEKFMQVSRDVGVMTYGLAVPGYRGISGLVEKTKENPEGHSTFDEVVESARGEFQTAFAEWREEFLEQRGEDLPEGIDRGFTVGFVLGGYDHIKNLFRVVKFYSDDNFSGTEIDRNRTFAAAQWQVSQFLFDNVFYPEMTVEQLVDLAVLALLETQSVEAGVGGPIQLATVTLDKGFQRLHDEDLRPVIRRSQRRIVQIRKTLVDELLGMVGEQRGG